MKNKNQQNKSILKSPLNALQEYEISLTNEQLKLFKQLIADKAALESKLAEQVDARKAQSALIGNAKKAGEPVSEYLDKVKSYSITINSYNDQIKDINDQIINYFTLENSNQDYINSELVAETNKPSAAAQANQPKINLENITIELFNSGSAGTCNTNSTIDTSLESLNTFINNHPNGSIYHQFSWLALIKQTFNHDGFYFVAKSTTDEIVGALPLVRLKSRLFGDFLISMPYFNYGAAIADDNSIEILLIEKGNALASKLGVDYVEYRDTKKSTDMPTKSDKVNMILSLAKSEDVQWQSFSAKLKSQIRKSKKQDFIVKQGGIELLNDFYAVFSENMRDLGTPVYAKSFFSNILKTFNNEASIIVVKDRAKTVSAGFLLKHKNQLEIPWASTLSKYNIKNANMFLYWHIIKFAIQSQCTTFDFGRSSVDSGTYRFKKQWGAKPLQSYWYYWLNDSIAMPKLNPSNPKYKLVIAVWKRLPLFITNLLGPIIVKNLP